MQIGDRNLKGGNLKGDRNLKEEEEEGEGRGEVKVKVKWKKEGEKRE